MDIDWMTAAVAGCWAFTATIALRLRRDIRETQLRCHSLMLEMQQVLRLRQEVSEMKHYTLDELRREVESIRAAAPPGVDHPPRAGADLTSPAPAVSPDRQVAEWFGWRLSDEDDGA